MDKNNDGPSIIVMAGDYEGGEFQVMGFEAFDPRGKAWAFNGLDPHQSLPFKRERISLIWFTHASWREASEEQLLELEGLGFRPPARGVDKQAKPQRTEGMGVPMKPRPIANLAFFEGVGSMAVVLKRLNQEVVAHLSWETNGVTQDFLASTYPRAVQMGCAESAKVKTVRDANPTRCIGDDIGRPTVRRPLEN